MPAGSTSGSNWRGLAPSDFADYRVITDPQVDPEGRRVAYVVTSADRPADRMVPEVWVTVLGDERRARVCAGPRRFASGPSHSPRFSPDGRWLAFVADRGAGPQLHVAPLDGGDARCLTSAPRGVLAPAWSPDGRFLTYVARVGGPAVLDATATPAQRNAPREVRHLRDRFDGLGWLDGIARVHIVALDTAVAEAVSPEDVDAESPCWSPDGKRLAYVADVAPNARNRSYRGDIWVQPANVGGRPRRLTKGTGPVTTPAWSPDGHSIAFFGNDAGDALWAAPTEVRVVAASGGPIASLTSRWDRSAGMRGVAEGAQLAWDPDGQSLLFCGADAGYATLWRVPRAGGAVRPVVSGDRHIPALALTPDGRHVVFAERAADRLPSLRVAPARGRGAERALAEPNADLAAAVALAPVERHAHEAEDGTTIETFVLRPLASAAKAKKPPVALDVHGGPHGWHPSPSARMFMLHQCLAAAGYVVVLPNPRGSLGYGAAFTKACVGDWGGADYNDVLGALDHAIAATGADRRRQFIWGYSFGGFMTAWAVGHTNRFRAAVIGAPVGHLASMALTTDITGFSLYENGDPWKDPQASWAQSPVAHLRAASTPSLILVHDGDLRCPPSQAEALFTALVLAECPTELVRYPGGSHGVATPSQIIDQVERSLDWFARSLVSGP